MNNNKLFNMPNPQDQNDAVDLQILTERFWMKLRSLINWNF